MQIQLRTISLLLIILILTVPSFSANDSGGTEGTAIFAAVGGGFEWNEIHGFVIEENDIKVDEAFNVTLCENVRFSDDKWKPSGHIFDEIEGIHWDDEPEPHLTISNQDFEDYKEDENNLTVYVYGEYYDEDHEDEKKRCAYKTVTVTKPNNPPVPVAWVAEEGNWTWFNLSEESEVTFVVEDGYDIQLWFDGSNSWDPDGEAVTDWKWDLDEDGSFGGAGENGENLSKVLTTGRSYDLGLKVSDERGRESDTSLDFTIHVQSPERHPDLTVSEITYANKNQNKQNYEVGDIIIVQPKIDNIGDNDTKDSFKVLLEYSYKGGAYSTIEEQEITNTIPASNLVILTFNWDTSGYPEGQYILKVTADFQNVIEEEYEDNNENTTNIINLEQRIENFPPDLSIEFVSADKVKPKVNEVVNITVSVINEGEGDANYVDAFFDINGEDQYFRTFDLIAAGTNDTMIFTFSGDAEGTFTLGYLLKDDGIQVGEKETVQIIVEKEQGQIPVPVIESISPNPGLDTDTVSFEGYGTDDGTIERYVWTSDRDSELHNSTTSDFDTDGLSLGEHTIYLKVQDNYGLWSEEVFTTLTIHGKPTSKIIEVSPNPATEGKAVTFSGSGTDDGTIETYFWRTEDRKLYKGTNSSFTLSNLSVGNHTIYLKVQDNYGVWSDEVTINLEVKQKDEDFLLFEYIGPLPIVGYVGIVAVVAIVGIAAGKKRKKKAKEGMTSGTVPFQPPAPGQYPPQVLPQYQQQQQQLSQYPPAQVPQQTPQRQYGQSQTPQQYPQVQPQAPSQQVTPQQYVQPQMPHQYPQAPQAVPQQIPMQQDGSWICPKCGNSLAGDFLFCMGCGYKRGN